MLCIQTTTRITMHLQRCTSPGSRIGVNIHLLKVALSQGINFRHQHGKKSWHGGGSSHGGRIERLSTSSSARQTFSHQPAYITTKKPFQLYVRRRHCSIAPAHTNNRNQSSYTSRWLSSSSSAAPLRATPAGSLPWPPPSRSKSLQQSGIARA